MFNELNQSKKPEEEISYCADIRIEIPYKYAICIDDAIEIAQEYVDLLTEQEENMDYNIFVKKIIRI